MPAVVVFVVWAVVVAVAAIILVNRLSKVRPTPEGGVSSGLGIWFTSILAKLSPLLVALCAYASGIGAVILVCWPAGLLAHAAQNTIDWPVFRWFEARQLSNWSRVWHVLTKIGMPRLTQGVTLVAALFFAGVWAMRRRRWWVPLVIFPVAYMTVKYLQIFLQDVVHRGHPPTTLGTYPSGGCARVIAIYGLVVLASLMWRWPQSRRAWVIGGSIVAGLWTVQAYARIYNLEHWTTDVVGGTIFGFLVLVTMAACLLILSPVGEKSPVDAATNTCAAGSTDGGRSAHAHDVA